MSRWTHHETRGDEVSNKCASCNNDREGAEEDVGFFLDQSTTPATKRVAGRAHVQLMRNDAVFTSVINLLQNVQCSQEILKTCLELQRAID
jgi:hypothetical protein